MKRGRPVSGSPTSGALWNGGSLVKRRWRVERVLGLLACLLAASFLLSGQHLQALSRTHLHHQGHRGHRPLHGQQLLGGALVVEDEVVNSLPFQGSTVVDGGATPRGGGLGRKVKSSARVIAKKKKKRDGKKKKSHDEHSAEVVKGHEESNKAHSDFSGHSGEGVGRQEGGEDNVTGNRVPAEQASTNSTPLEHGGQVGLDGQQKAAELGGGRNVEQGESLRELEGVLRADEDEEQGNEGPVEEQPVPDALPLWSLAVAELAGRHGTSPLVLGIPTLHSRLHLYRGQLVEERWGGLYSLLLLGVLYNVEEGQAGSLGGVASGEIVKQLRMACLVGSTRVVQAKVTPRAQLAGGPLFLHIECPLAPTFADPLMDHGSKSRLASEALILTSSELPVLLKALTGPTSPTRGRTVPLAEAPGPTLSMNLQADPTLVHTRLWNLTACVGPLDGPQEESLWVEFFEYQMMVAGVEHFFVYVYEEEHLKLPVLAYYEQRGVVSLSQWNKGSEGGLVVMANHCLLQNKHASSWTAFLQPGEFIQVHSRFNFSAAAYLESLDPIVGHVPLSVLRFPVQQMLSQHKYLQLESYQRRAELPEAYKRTIVAPGKVRAMANYSVDSYEPLQAASIEGPAPWDVIRVDRFEPLGRKPTAKEDKLIDYFDAPQERLAYWAPLLERRVRRVRNRLRSIESGAMDPRTLPLEQTNGALQGQK